LYLFIFIHVLSILSGLQCSLLNVIFNTSQGYATKLNASLNKSVDGEFIAFLYFRSKTFSEPSLSKKTHIHEVIHAHFIRKIYILNNIYTFFHDMTSLGWFVDDSLCFKWVVSENNKKTHDL